MLVNTSGAVGPTKVVPRGTLLGIWRFIGMVIRSRINGDYKQSVFFTPDAGSPMVKATVINPQDKPAV